MSGPGPCTTTHSHTARTGPSHYFGHPSFFRQCGTVRSAGHRQVQSYAVYHAHMCPHHTGAGWSLCCVKDVHISWCLNEYCLLLNMDILWFDPIIVSGTILYSQAITVITVSSVTIIQSNIESIGLSNYYWNNIQSVYFLLILQHCSTQRND